MTRGIALLLGVPALLRAQEASLFVGGARAQYAAEAAGSAAFAAARLTAGHRMQAGQLQVAYSAFTSGGWALQMDGQGTVLAGHGPFGGVAFAGVLNTYADGTPNGSAVGGPVVAFGRGRFLASLGAAAGAVRRIDSTWKSLGTATARWEASLGHGLAIDAGVTGTASDTLRMADLSLAGRWQGTMLRMAGVAGVRVGDLAGGLWGSVEAAWRPLEHASLEVAGGHYPRDLVGFTEGWYAQAGVRLFVSGRSPPRAAMELRRLDAGRVRLTVRVPRSITMLAVAGDWNRWLAIPMRRSRDGSWSADLPLASGVYHYALTTAGRWILPDGVEGVNDGFGGRVGILVVPR